MKTKAEVWIPLSQGKVAVIDFEDWDKIRGMKWRYLKSQGHAEYAHGWRRENGKSVWNYLHRVVWGERDIPPKFEIAHIDGDGLNCRRSVNLKCVTHAQNMQGKQGKKVNSPSQFRGVFWDSRPERQSWYAKIKHRKKAYFLGIFLTEEAAARAYDQKALELFGGHAALNFPAQKENQCQSSINAGGAA